VAFLLAGAIVLAYAGAAGAAPPQAQGMVLSTADFPDGATLLSQNASALPFLPHLAYSSTYTRSFSSVNLGGKRVTSLVASAVVAKDEGKLSSFVTELVAGARSKLVRTTIISQVKTELAAELKQKVTGGGFLRVRTMHTGDVALEFDFYIHTARIGLTVDEIFVQKGPALEAVVVTTGEPGLTAGQAFGLAKTANARITAASGAPPANTVAPSISGTPALGSILSARPGSWTGGGITFAYQWFRCNATGGACVAIPDATSASYTVSTADEGATVAVSVSATNPGGNTLVMSQPTAAVPTG